MCLTSNLTIEWGLKLLTAFHLYVNYITSSLQLDEDWNEQAGFIFRSREGLTSNLTIGWGLKHVGWGATSIRYKTHIQSNNWMRIETTIKRLQRCSSRLTSNLTIGWGLKPWGCPKWRDSGPFTFNLKIEWGLKHDVYKRFINPLLLTSNLTIGWGLKLQFLNGIVWVITFNFIIEWGLKRLIGLAFREAIKSHIQFYNFMRIETAWNL